MFLAKDPESKQTVSGVKRCPSHWCGFHGGSLPFCLSRPYRPGVNTRRVFAILRSPRFLEGWWGRRWHSREAPAQFKLFSSLSSLIFSSPLAEVGLIFQLHKIGVLSCSVTHHEPQLNSSGFETSLSPHLKGKWTPILLSISSCILKIFYTFLLFKIFSKELPKSALI